MTKRVKQSSPTKTAAFQKITITICNYYGIIFCLICQDIFTKYLKGGDIIVNANAVFVAEVDKQKRLKNLTNADIAKLTGYTRSTIDAFMGGFRDSNNVRKAIAEALKIED